MAYEKIEVTKFNGITDKPEDGEIDRFEELDNVFLRDNFTPQTRWGSRTLNGNTIYKTPTSITCKKILEYGSDKLLIAGENIYLDNGSSTLSLITPVNNAIGSLEGCGENSYYSTAFYKDAFLITSDLPSRPIRCFKEDTNGWTIISIGLPSLATSPSLSVTGGSGSGYSYIAGFCYKYDYTINSVLYEMRGPMMLIDALGSTGGSFAYSAIPVLANGSDTHYDVANIEVEIYRTYENQTTLYLDATVANGTTSYLSNKTNTQLGMQSYITGDVIDNYAPPKCKYIKELQNYIYYLNIDTDPSVGYQSKAGNPDGVGANSYFELPNEITGGGTVFNDIYVGTSKNIYRLDGNFSDTGTGAAIPRRVVNIDGIIYNESVIQGTYGFAYAGPNSFCFFGGDKSIPVNDFDETYKQIMDNSSSINKIVGTFDTLNKRYIWACCENATSRYNDSWYVMHEKLGITNRSVFTTASAKGYFYPMYVEYLSDNSIFRADKGGWLMLHKDSYQYDLKYDTTKLPSQWTKKAIMDLIITSYLYGPKGVKKWGCKLLSRFKNLTNMSMTPSVASNGSKNFKPMNRIEVRYQAKWGDPHIYWQDAESWYYMDNSDIMFMRSMPMGFARFYSRQIKYEKAFAYIYGPEQRYAATITVDTNAQTVTFNGETPANLLDLYIIINEKAYLIIKEIQATTNVFMVSDPHNTLVDGDYSDWFIKGYPINEKINLLEAIMYYVPFGEPTSQTKPANPAGTNR